MSFREVVHAIIMNTLKGAVVGVVIFGVCSLIERIFF